MLIKKVYRSNSLKIYYVQSKMKLLKWPIKMFGLILFLTKDKLAEWVGEWMKQIKSSAFGGAVLSQTN